MLIRWWMDFWGYTGLATFWDTIYFREKKYMTEKLMRHEEMHIKQMHRDGKFIYAIKYNYFWITRGYWNNPYEIEARDAE